MPFMGIGYFKGEPNEFIMVYRSGVFQASGKGMTFFYWAPSTSIVSIPTGTIDVPFFLTETTGNFQTVTIQGQLTYHIKDPQAVAAILNYAIDPFSRAYLSSDPEKLPQRIVNEIQGLTRGEILQLSLEDIMRRSVEVADRVLGKLKQNKALADIGLDILSLHIISIKPTPEMAKALEAEYREGLQTKADQAIYHRRAMAVEQERRIKENELGTQVTLEQKRQELVDLQGKNNKQEAEYQAAANAIQLGPYKELSPQTLLALSIKEIGQNASKIGNLTITSEILESLLKK